LKPRQLDRLLWRTSRSAPAVSETRIVRTSLSDVRIRDSGGDRPAIAFLCDPPVTVEAYDQLIGLLSPAFRVLVVELPGFGFSTPHSAEAYGFQAAVSAVEEALRSLRPGPLVVAGPCVCGFVAAAIARRGNLDLRGLILMQTPDLAGMRAWTDRMDPKGRLRTPYIGQMLVRLNAKRLARFWIGYACGQNCDHRPLASATIAALDAGGAYPLATMLQDWGDDLEDSAIDVAAVAVWGRDDRSHRQTDSESTLRHVPAAEVMQFEDCGHFVELEDAPEFVLRIRPFLEGCLRSS